MVDKGEAGFKLNMIFGVNAFRYYTVIRINFVLKLVRITEGIREEKVTVWCKITVMCTF